MSFLLHRTTTLPQPLEPVFEFFSNAQNLQVLTPPWVGFEILSPVPVTMRVGETIDYRIRLRGIPVRWQSEITSWEPPYRFVDEQRRGPYRSWRHEHRFKEVDGATQVVDDIEYRVHGGRLVNRLFVSRDLKSIFDYRQEKLRGLFSTPTSQERS